MVRKLLFSFFSACLLVWPGRIQAQPTASDPEVVRGIRQVDDGEYDAAIVTLDNAARRLAADAAHAPDLPQAYIYLGIAYVGKGREAAAKAQFREALARIKDLSLSAEKYPPKIVDLFEAAKAEARADAGTAAPPKKGGASKGLLIGGAVAAAAAGVALAAGGGGESSGSGSSTPPTSSTSPAPAPATTTDVFEGVLNRSQTAATIPLPAVSTAGPWRAELSWTGDRTEVRMFILDAVTRAGVVDVRLVTPNSSLGEWPGEAGKRYVIDLFLQEGGASQSNYTLRVTHPR